MKLLKSLIFLFVALPSLAQAQVFISEIAWMGSVDSANHEWIELYNSGVSVDATGWRLSDGSNLEIILDGVISQNEFVVLERTSDLSVAGSAWQIYTGALPNTGATLSLYDAANNRIDQVVGGENWENIGGNNETKDTAQLFEEEWITAPASPGTAPVNITATAVETSENSSVSFAPFAVAQVKENPRPVQLQIKASGMKR